MNLRIALLLLCLNLSVGCSPLLNPPKGNLVPFESPEINEDCPLDFEQANLCAKLVPTRVPVPVMQRTVFELYFWNRDSGNPSGPYTDPSNDGYEVRVKLWMYMPAGSHGSNPVIIEPNQNQSHQPIQGVYRLSQLVFSMPGKWEVHVGLFKGSVQVEQVIYEILI